MKRKGESSTCNLHGYNQTLTLENRSTISSHVNWTGRINDSSLSITMSLNRLNNYYGVVRKVYKEFTKLHHQDLNLMTEILLRTKIESNKALDIAATPESNLCKNYCKQICGDTTRISCKI